MMSLLGFRCCYTTAKDVEHTSPCGRHATRREQGESKCLGHRVIEWLVRAYGRDNPERARMIYGRVFTLAAFIEVAWGAQAVMNMFAGTNYEYSTVQACVGISLTGFFGGIALGFTLEHSLGGKLWLTFAPLSSVALLFLARIYLSGRNPRSTSRLVDLLYANVYFVVAFAILAGWLIFLLEYSRRYRLAVFLNFVCEVLGVALVLAGIGLALASRGAESSVLVTIVILIGLAVMVRGMTRLKKLAKILRV